MLSDFKTLVKSKHMSCKKARYFLCGKRPRTSYLWKLTSGSLPFCSLFTLYFHPWKNHTFQVTPSFFLSDDQFVMNVSTSVWKGDEALMFHLWFQTQCSRCVFLVPFIHTIGVCLRGAPACMQMISALLEQMLCQVLIVSHTAWYGRSPECWLPVGCPALSWHFSSWIYLLLSDKPISLASLHAGFFSDNKNFLITI